MANFTAPRVGKLVRKETRAQRLNRLYSAMTDRQLRDRYETEYEAGDDPLAIRLLEVEMDHRGAWL
jgi:hypothetical protein